MRKGGRGGGGVFFFFAVWAGSCFLCCLGGGVFCFAVWAGAWPPPKQQKVKHSKSPNNKKDQTTKHEHPYPPICAGHQSPKTTTEPPILHYSHNINNSSTNSSKSNKSINYTRDQNLIPILCGYTNRIEQHLATCWTLSLDVGNNPAYGKLGFLQLLTGTTTHKLTNVS